MSKLVDQDVVADDRRLRVRWFAPRLASDDPVIVLLHQGLGSVSQWREFPRALAAAAGCAVVGYDRVGHGGSDALTPPRPADFFEVEACGALPDVLEALGINKPILYGHSDGGTIALLFAARFPDRACAVISEAAHVFSEVEETGGVGRVVEEFQRGDLRDRLARHHGEKIDAMFWAWAEFWLRAKMRDWQITDQLAAIRAPLLVIQGDNDEHGTIAQVQTIARSSGGSVETFTVPACGHSPHLEATDAVAARAGEFVRRALSGG
jgi:pimeloyl-ACP methyl ester carboxylesterase